MFGLRQAVFVLIVALGPSADGSVILQRQDPPDTVINLQGLGLIRGSLGQTARTNQTIIQFYNIPYAEAPIGSRRFKAPVKIGTWTDVLNVTEPGRECPQPVEGMNQDNEDCLTLSVFTKDVSCVIVRCLCVVENRYFRYRQPATIRLWCISMVGRSTWGQQFNIHRTICWSGMLCWW